MDRRKYEEVAVIGGYEVGENKAQKLPLKSLLDSCDVWALDNSISSGGGRQMPMRGWG